MGGVHRATVCNTKSAFPCAFEHFGPVLQTARICLSYTGLAHVYVVVAQGLKGLANRRFRPLSHLSTFDYQRFTKAASDPVELHVDYTRPSFQPCRRKQVKPLAAAWKPPRSQI
jgi:hypothetical protein